MRGSKKKRPSSRDLRIAEQKLLRILTRKAWEKQEHRCYHCGTALPTVKEATGDHYPKARYQGGQTTADNIVASCGKCNGTRNTETNRHGGRLNMTVGDDTPRSPFEKLRELFNDGRNGPAQGS